MPSFTRPPSRVAIVRSPDYDRDLSALLFDAMREFDLPVAGKKVVLKPNFVEPDPEGIINTNPAVVAAAREAFLRLGAQSVRVAEGPGHERDTEAIVETLRLERVSNRVVMRAVSGFRSALIFFLWGACR